ncbi:BolA family protein [Cereibacter sediminicola]|uniref:BolA family protein n=1 Tax=Cereibacter sediminicola TaxID=2584941 RepID=UPI00119DEE29|nr:BolA family protein [Cereibacter sediminicola]
MGVVEEIRDRLEAAFAPHELEVTDESEKHRGHAGWREGGETHFHVRMRAGAMAALSRLERHRAVYAALGQDLVGRIHALALDLEG